MLLERAIFGLNNSINFLVIFMHITEIIKNEHSKVIYSAVTMAECAANDLKQEQRGYCKIRGKLGISALEIQHDLEIVYGEQALSYRTVARWVSLLKDGRNHIEDEPRPGRPPSTASERDVATVKRIVEDARYTIEETSDISGLNSSLVFFILK